MCACVLLASSTKHETSLEIKEIFSEKNEAYDIIKRPGHQLSIELSENIAYSTVKQEPDFDTPQIYEIIN